KTSILHLAERTPEEARVTYRLDRGAWDRPKERVFPHVPAALHPLRPADYLLSAHPGDQSGDVSPRSERSSEFIPPKRPEPTRPAFETNPRQLDSSAKLDRLTFARWLADKRSPLTARVAVNRVW